MLQQFLQVQRGRNSQPRQQLPERLRKAVVPPHKDKVVVILCQCPAIISAMITVIIWVLPICSTTTSACQFHMTRLQLMSMLNTCEDALSPGERLTSLAHSSFDEPLVGEYRGKTCLSFSVNEGETRPETWVEFANDCSQS